MTAAPTTRVELGFRATKPDFARAFEELRGRLDQALLAPGTRYRVELVFEEIVTNVMLHGCSAGAVANVTVAVEAGEGCVVMTIANDGPPFDPSRHVAPPPPASLEDAHIGGLGLTLVRRSVDALDYDYPDGRNRLVVRIGAVHR